MLRDDQGTEQLRNIAENFNRMSKAHERYRQTSDRQMTDGLATAYSKREREFAIARKLRFSINK